MNDLIQQESLGSLVAKQLRQSIWKKEIQFGERLIENDLSEKYNVSRSTIRDALKILEYEEMVVGKPRKGTYVSEFTMEDWHETIELRIIIEVFAFVKALSFLGEQQVIDLSNILGQMKIKAKENNWSDLFDLDMQFHSYVVNLAGNKRIIKMYNSIQVQIRTFLLYLDEYYTNPESFYNEQRELFNSFLTKDTKVIDETIRKHIQYVEGKFLADALMNKLA